VVVKKLRKEESPAQKAARSGKVLGEESGEKVAKKSSGEEIAKKAPAKNAKKLAGKEKKVCTDSRRKRKHPPLLYSPTFSEYPQYFFFAYLFASLF
jgi:hypothetical protein